MTPQKNSRRFRAGLLFAALAAEASAALAQASPESGESGWGAWFYLILLAVAISWASGYFASRQRDKSEANRPLANPQPHSGYSQPFSMTKAKSVNEGMAMQAEADAKLKEWQASQAFWDRKDGRDGAGGSSDF